MLDELLQEENAIRDEENRMYGKEEQVTGPDVMTQATTKTEIDSLTISDMPVEVTIFVRNIVINYNIINQLKFSTYEYITRVHCGGS